MNEPSKITSENLLRCAIVYVRQSSTTQVEHNRESTARQYALAERAAKLGWRRGHDWRAIMPTGTVCSISVA